MSTSKRTPDEFPSENEPVEPLAHTQPQIPVDSAQPGDPSGGEVAELESDPVSVYESDNDSEMPEPLAAHTDENKIPVTKLVRLWFTTIVGIIVLGLLIVFIAQNQDVVTVRFFAAQGQLNLGLLLFIAALGGALIVTILGVIRVLQIRANARRERKARRKGL